MPPADDANSVSFPQAYENFRLSLSAVMAQFRHEANHHTGTDRAYLETASTILSLLENAYSEAVWLNHKLERRILGLD